MVSQRVAGVPPVVATGEPEGWEVVCCVYLMVSWHTIERNLADETEV
ncbi:MAG: hypothetical protein NHB32_14445 [Fischerella sp. CENA71]|nr:hypothetical protein [Fischerella sp. CENA71]